MSRATPGTRAGYRAFSTMTTRWFDNDMYGHMNNALHYQLFDTAVNGHLIAQGVLDPRGSPHVFLVVEAGCVYFGEMGFPDTIHAGIRVTRLGGSSVTYGVGLFRNDDDRASAEGHFVHVNVDRQTRRPVAIPQKTRAVLDALRADS